MDAQPADTPPRNGETDAEEPKVPLLERLEEADRRLRTLIRNHPTTAVFAAVAVGFALGRILR